MFYRVVTKKYRLPFYLAIIALIFQSFSPLVHAFSSTQTDTTSQARGAGYYTILCTAKGFESVWVSTEQAEATDSRKPDNSEYASPFKCPSCILAEASSVFLPTDQWLSIYTDLNQNITLFYSNDDLSKQTHWKHSFAIRAPPANHLV